MSAPLTDHAQSVVSDIAARYGLSRQSVEMMLDAVVRGGGTMAQFNIAELGGGGQWMSGGMTMVGDMFNNGLKNTVNYLCGELSQLTASGPVYLPAPARQGGPGYGGPLFASQGSNGSWWPSELGNPSSTGGQNQLSYAVFPSTRRLAISEGGRVTIFDTGDHQIGGVSQQQGTGAQSVVFSSQFGSFTAATLPVVGGDTGQSEPPPPAPSPSFSSGTGYNATPPSGGSGQGGSLAPSDITAALESLADLYGKGILTEAEFTAKKAELLGRL